MFQICCLYNKVHDDQNKVLHYFGISWIINTNKHLEYDTEKYNPDWVSGGPWYNIYICKKLYGKVFENFIRNVRTRRYNLMCSIDAHENQSIRI